jgi:hypothetical protein
MGDHSSDVKLVWNVGTNAAFTGTFVDLFYFPDGAGEAGGFAGASNSRCNSR